MEVRRPLVAATLAVLVAVAAACGGGNGGGEPGGETAMRSITVWILENEPDRIAATMRFAFSLSSLRSVGTAASIWVSTLSLTERASSFPVRA